MATGVKQQQRRGLAADWNTSNHVLDEGELGVTTDTGIIKIGDGVNGWNDLPAAFGSAYLPMLGKAADSELLDGIDSSGYFKLADATTAATGDKLVKRLSDGRAKIAAGSASDDAVNFAQMGAADTATYNLAIVDARKTIIARTLADATTTFALDAGDAGGLIVASNSSLTAQRVVTIPTNASVAFPIGTQIDICSADAGNLKLVPSGGVNLFGTPNIFGSFSVARLLKTGTNDWLVLHLSNKNQTRRPRIRAVRTTTTGYTNGTYIFVPYDSIDSTRTFNPENEWFSLPASGLPTGRRIIINKTGEYHIECNFISSASTETYTSVNMMTADNSHTGERLLAMQATNITCNITVEARLTAGDSIGVAHSTTSSGSDVVDGGFAGYRNDLTITRVGD